MPDLIVPYEGGQVVMTEQAQAAAAAAQELTTVDPAFAQVVQGKRGVQNLDPDSENSRQEVLRQMRMSPPKPCTILNLHPWPLTFGATTRLLRGITVPACEPGMQYAKYTVRGYRMDWKYDEDGRLKFYPVLPVDMAAQFLREFSNKDAYGGGVIIYLGEESPEKCDMVETYDPIGRPLTARAKGVEYDPESNEPIPTVLEMPVARKLSNLIEEQRNARNSHYMNRVRKADHDYKLPDGRGKWLINDTHLLMAQVLFAQGLLQKLPEWNLTSRFEAGLSESNCPACMGTPRDGAFQCSCGHILKPLEAYRAGAIQWGHASMETMTSDELDEAEEIRAERQSTKNRLRAPAKKAADEEKA
jgi:hypothetical protein